MEALFSFLATFWQALLPLFIVQEYEGAVHLRLGRFYRTVEPGIYWKIPFGLDLIHRTNVKPGPATMRAQSLVTADGVDVVIQARIIWSVSDVRTFLIEIEGEDAILSDAVYGVITEQVAAANWDDIRTEAFRHACHKAARARARKLGASVDNLYFSDVARMQSFRLITGWTPQHDPEAA
ncbi:MAG: SPFH domain-containing protein [Rhodospirillaceae bacterium]